jgi:hypothetical protein
MKSVWPYWLGALLLALLNIGLFLARGVPWGITQAFSYWGGKVAIYLGVQVDHWTFFQKGNPFLRDSTYFFNSESLLNVGLVAGATLSALAASEFRLRKLRSLRYAVMALVGGILMGYGARISLGCNVGSFYSGVSCLSFHGWFFLIFVLFGTYLGTKILWRIFF